jgi:hypothetical protein
MIIWTDKSDRASAPSTVFYELKIPAPMSFVSRIKGYQWTGKIF